MDSRGRASMVDVSAKPVTTRTASARAEVCLLYISLAPLRDDLIGFFWEGNNITLKKGPPFFKVILLLGRLLGVKIFIYI